MDNRYFDLLSATSDDLAANESFQAFVLNEGGADIAFWQDFIFRHPEKQRDFNEAIELIRALRFHKKELRPDIKAAHLQQLLAKIDAEQIATVTIPRRADRHSPIARRPFLSGSYRTAASLAGILMVMTGAIYLFFGQSFSRDMVTLQSGYGENTTVTLPDSSTVILNGNTKLTYRADWDDKTQREVWLEGEAFFDVHHKGTEDKNRFIVHTPQMNVEVLGTRFNVFNRADKANVVLNSGKVRLNFDIAGDSSTVLLVPNEAVEFSRKDLSVIKKRVNAESLTSWRNKVWVFENTPLQSIAEMIEYNFGVETTFGAGVDPREQLVGTVPSGNLDVLLEVLSKTSDLEIVRNGQQIVISKRHRTTILP